MAKFLNFVYYSLLSKFVKSYTTTKFLQYGHFIGNDEIFFKQSSIYKFTQSLQNLCPQPFL